MILARVIGTVVATRKDERLAGKKLLVVKPVDERGRDLDGSLVALDAVQAGFHETVVVVAGSSARMATGMKDVPTDATIVGIVDTVDVDDGTPEARR